MEEAVEDMKQYGASLVQPVAQAAEATRAQGQSVLQQGGGGGGGDFLLREIKKDTPRKINIEPENDGLEDDFPFPGVYSQVPC